MPSEASCRRNRLKQCLKVFLWFTVLILLICPALTPKLALAAVGSWSSNGPTLHAEPYGNAIDSLALSPQFAVDQKIFAGASEGGIIYLSKDAANSWTEIQMGQETRGFHAIAVATNQTVFAASGNHYEVFRSSDGGVNWTNISRWGDATGVPQNAHWAIATSPNYVNDQTVFIAGNYGVIRSIDGGANWYNVSQDMPEGTKDTLAISPGYATDKTIFAGGYGGVFFTNNGGVAWAPMNTGLPNSPSYFKPWVSSLAISPNYSTDKTLFAINQGQGLYKSNSGGVSWQKLDLPQYENLSPYLTCLAISPNYANDHTVLVWAGYASYSTFLLSQDGGVSWAELPATAKLPSSGSSVAFSPDFANDRKIFAGVSGIEGANGVYSYIFPPANHPPVADAGQSQTVHVGAQIILTGSGSDPDGDLITAYNWSISSRPEGSVACLVNPNLPGPTFTPDKVGDYEIQLVVTDSRGAMSSPSKVIVSTDNSPPVAEAGPDQLALTVGGLVTLDGTNSFDNDGDPLTYEWTITNKPSDSSATLDPADPHKPTFLADAMGDYVIQLVVRDSWCASSPDTVKISFTNLAPVANAGRGGAVEVGEAFTLDGSGSADANGDPLSYRWSIVSAPSGSTAFPFDTAARTTTFVPNLPGTYSVQLVVNDGLVNSTPSTIQVQAVSDSQQVAIVAIKEVVADLAAFSPSTFRNDKLQNALINKLNAVLGNIEAGNYQEALGQLQHDILAKTDGCNISGAPDKNDWIIDTCAQEKICPLLMAIIDDLKKLTP